MGKGLKKKRLAVKNDITMCTKSYQNLLFSWLPSLHVTSQYKCSLYMVRMYSIVNKCAMVACMEHVVELLIWRGKFIIVLNLRVIVRI